jgi:hypothetical protein
MTYSIGLLGGVSAGFGAVSYTVTSTPTAARAGQLPVRRAGSNLVMSWRLMHPSTVIGFNLYGGVSRLNTHVIPAHRDHMYTFITKRSSAPRYMVELLLDNGKRGDVQFSAVRQARELRKRPPP